MFGLVSINKPAGITSRDVVNRVQRLIKPVKVGHAGTLDPLATGVLVLCLGPATRLIEYVQRAAKTYRGVFLLGQSSTTEDVEGEITALADPPRPTREEIIAAARNFVGEIMQRPPAFSALKVGGRRAYKLARAGAEVELAPRPVMIHRLDVADYVYPELTLEIGCGSGTYVRSLGRDLAASLGTAAVMSALCRTAIGEFQLADAWPLDQVRADNAAEWLQPALRAVANLPRVVLDDAEIARVSSGLAIERGDSAAADEIAAVDAGGELIALLAPRGPGRWGPTRVFRVDPSPDNR